MNVQFSPGEEALLLEVARHAGKSAEQLVKEAALRLIKEDAEFRGATKDAIEQADRGELIDEEEMDARVRLMTRR